MFYRDRLGKYSFFLIPFLIRLIPELLNPYPIGYDSGHYIWALTNFQSGEIFPLFQDRYAPLVYIILYLVKSVTTLPSDWVIKIVPSVLFGVLGYAVGRYGERSVNRRFGLVMVLLFSLNLASLRLSWDLLKQVMANIFLVFALPYLLDDPNPRKEGYFTALSILSVLSHQTTIINIGLVATYYSVSKKRWWFLGSLSLVGLAVSPIALRYVTDSVLSSFMLLTVFDSLNFMMVSMPVLVLLGGFGLYQLGLGDRVMACFLISGFLFSLTVAGGGFAFSGWRFAATLSIPLSYYAARGTILVKEITRKYPVVSITILMAAAYTAPMVLGLNPVQHTVFMPKNFSDNIFPYQSQHEMEALIKASEWCSMNTPENALILTEDSMVDWVKLYAGREVQGWWSKDYNELLNSSKSLNRSIYIIWWYIDDLALIIVKETFTPGSDLKIMKIKP